MQTLVYDSDGRGVDSVDAMASVTQSTFDANGNVIATTQFAAPVTPRDIWDLASLSTATAAIANAANDRTTRFVFDAENRQVYRIDALGNVIENAYDKGGNVSSTTQRAARVSLSGNPSLAQVATALSNAAAQAVDDRVTRYAYDAASRRTHSIDALGGVTKLVYDTIGRVAREIRYANPVTLTGNPTGAQIDTALINSWDRRETIHAFDRGGREIYTAQGWSFSLTVNEYTISARQYDTVGRLTQTTRHATPVSSTGLGVVQQSPTGLPALFRI